MLLSFPSFHISVLVFLDATFLTVQIWSHPLRPFFALEIEYGIDDRSLVLESPLF